MTVVVAQISDTHLGGSGRSFMPAVERVVRHLNANAAALVVHTGDITLDGVNDHGDFDEAVALLRTLVSPLRCLPGNHDVGEALLPDMRETQVSGNAIAAYGSRFGADRWIHDCDGWRLVGINAQLLGSDLPLERDQYRWIIDAVRGRGDRSLGLFTHKPLFDRAADETIVGGRFVNPTPRRKLLEALGDTTPTFIGSGHVHQFRASVINRSAHIWAPSTSFVFPDRLQPVIGEKTLGYIEHRLEADGGHKAALVRVPGLPTVDLDHFPGAYGHV